MKKILVTGAGALLGQGILRSIDKSKYFVHTADPQCLASGHWLGAFAHLIPFANHPDYLSEIIEIVKKFKIDVVLVGTDVELFSFANSRQYFLDELGVNVIVSNPEVIEIANDKWLTAEFLRKNNFPYALSALTHDKKGLSKLLQKCDFPLIAKPVNGARSIGLELINSSNELEKITSYQNNLVVQEYLPSNEGEFTSGCIVERGKTSAVVTLKRDLRDGNTFRAFYKKEFEKYSDFISKVAETLGVEGPCNFQFRIKNGIPIIFEINARFSGTTPLRKIFGFNEVEALLRSIFEKKKITKPVLKEGVVLRTVSDIFIHESIISSYQKFNEFKNPECNEYNFII